MESVHVGFSVSARTDREGPLPGQQKGQEGRENDLGGFDVLRQHCHLSALKVDSCKVTLKISKQKYSNFRVVGGDSIKEIETAGATSYQ